jgi:hypothetical protein
MDSKNTIPTGSQTAQQPQPQKRAWITPAFDQVALKDALNSRDNVLANDGISQSS